MGCNDSLSFKVITRLPPDTEGLIAQSENEGYRFVRKLTDEWISGENRFDKPGEIIYGGFSNSTLIGVCGLNQDPYTEKANVGRLRHLYVDAEYRGNGIARMLISRCLENASKWFVKIRLRTPNESVNRFYVNMGFNEVNDPTATHEVVFNDWNSQPKAYPGF